MRKYRALECILRHTECDIFRTQGQILSLQNPLNASKQGHFGFILA